MKNNLTSIEIYTPWERLLIRGAFYYLLIILLLIPIAQTSKEIVNHTDELLGEAVKTGKLHKRFSQNVSPNSSLGDSEITHLKNTAKK